MNRIVSRARKRRLVVLAACSALAAIGSGVALATTTDSSTPPPYAAGTPPVDQPVVSSPVPPVSSPAVALLASFGVLRRSHVAADAAPSDIIDRDTLDRGANPALARLATTVKSQSVYVVPADGGLCLLSTSFLAMDCFSTADLKSGVQMETIVCSPYLDPSEVELFGLIPDGVSQMHATYSDGASKPVAVSGNVFVIDAPRSGPYPTELGWHDAHGDHTRATHLDQRSAAAPCGGPGSALAIRAQRAAIGAWHAGRNSTQAAQAVDRAAGVHIGSTAP